MACTKAKVTSLLNEYAPELILQKTWIDGLNKFIWEAVNEEGDVMLCAWTLPKMYESIIDNY